jgi:hypothetical protein
MKSIVSAMKSISIAFLEEICAAAQQTGRLWKRKRGHAASRATPDDGYRMAEMHTYAALLSH